MPLIITDQDMIDTYGQREMIQLTDRSVPKTGGINTTLLNANIDDAEAEILTPLGCCFAISDILDTYVAGRSINIIEHWIKVTTRLHLYGSLERDDSQVSKAYKDAKEELEELCKCGTLFDNEGNEIPRKTKFSFIEDKCWCCCNPCRCGRWKVCL